MKNKLFTKNLLLFLVPLLIPIIILGTLCILITNHYIQGEMNKNNANLFHQIDRNVDMIFNEIHSLKIKFNSPEVLYRLEEILRTQRMTWENVRLIESVQNDINVPVYTKPYIESIYVYVRNDYDQFLASGEGVAKLSAYHDVEWLESFNKEQDNTGVWTQQRTVQRYSFSKAVPVTTFYKNIYSVLGTKPVGVIVLNIYSEHIEKLLSNIEVYPGQSIFIVDERKQIILKSRPLDVLEGLDVSKLLTASSSYTIDKEGDTYYVATPHTYSNQYGWTYYSIAAKRTLSQIPFRLSTFTLFCVLLSFVLGLLLTYFLTKQNLKHIRHMISIIHSAERGLPLPELPMSKGTNEYEFITQRLIKNFIEQNYLQVQLSEKKYKMQALEMSALQSQMNPHFLFNTLETIYWKVMGLTGKPNEANHMLEHLSDLMKYALDAPNKIVTLEKEINYTKSYLEIQKIRYRDKFDIVWDYDAEDSKKYSVMKLTLQPLIENCIYHGIKVKEGRSCIKIKIQRLSNGIQITVTDSGVGMSKERLRRVRDTLKSDVEVSDHIGLANTNRRLKLTYGLEESLVIRSKPRWGTSVTFTIPL